jgi:two-component system OmpR family response regulator
MFRVMLVEDDVRLAALAKEYLEAYEFAVDIVDRGDTALAHFGATQPDLVVLDLTLPGLDGMVVCRQIRQTSRAPTTMCKSRCNHACCWHGCAL